MIPGLFLIPAITNGGEHESPAEAIYNLDRPIVIGHRGYKGFAPENTLPSMELAVQSGADLVELDVHFSRDGIPVVIHDRTLDRTTNSIAAWGSQEVPVKAKSAAELATLDAGAWYSECYSGTRIPLLGEVLRFIRENNGVTLIDRKQGDAASFTDLLRELDLTKAVIVQAFDWEFLADLHALGPDIILSAAGPARTWKGKTLTDEERALSKDWIDRAKGAGARALAWNDQVSRESIDYAHEKDMKVWVYTINEEAQTRQLLDLGADGVITDNPSVIWKAYFLHSMRQ